MKALLTALAVAAACGPAFADAVAKRTPNGGIEYYSNHHPNEGTIENGCILPWRYAGYMTMGYNPKRIDMGEVTEFVDCKIPEPVRKVRHYQRHYPAPVPTTQPPVVVVPAPAPAPVMEQPLPVRE